MTPDSLTNFLYLADTLPKKYPEFYARLEKELKEQKVDFDFLPGTKDVWAVDYMPIQVGDRFIQFRYDPGYLKPQTFHKTISDVDAICAALGIETVKPDIVLDGGNLVRSQHQAILTNRVFQDNPDWDRKKLLFQIQDLLELDRIILIPEQPGDYTGHADGMVRFIDEHTLLANDFSREEKEFYEAFEIALHNTGLEVVYLPYNVYQNPNNNYANGDYINYLQMRQGIFVPTFGLPEDEKAIQVIETCFPDQKIIPIESNDLAKDGGILNCISWNIFK
ncbi:agmatine deiminase family protein [Algoriphagus sp. CAU 1675]|uniref:agmatine deiminase family protein n=1 Tax=Algoriphagus sp. CAU 1675 TaxID=3032597 RepID=UPI0023DC08DE|nr:agmatine deiminase family protein [Algoriphagus sp. CAU 1675]MDF2157292.1 agmatine deiminase family protein [Algoriphagus sp. CAU 1675]